jgi:hypothetical protein
MEEHKRRVVKTIWYKKPVVDKTTKKTYKVIVKFLEVSEEEAKMKLEMIKDIMKRRYLQKEVGQGLEE